MFIPANSTQTRVSSAHSPECPREIQYLSDYAHKLRIAAAAARARLKHNFIWTILHVPWCARARSFDYHNIARAHRYSICLHTYRMESRATYILYIRMRLIYATKTRESGTTWQNRCAQCARARGLSRAVEHTYSIYTHFYKIYRSRVEDDVLDASCVYVCVCVGSYIFPQNAHCAASQVAKITRAAPHIYLWQLWRVRAHSINASQHRHSSYYSWRHVNK